MKICGIICEYNPFHNGHARQLREAKRLSQADAIVCILSEHFTQRGEATALPARVRAKHAILGGADAVISLPVPFACSPAEIFAKGAIKILASLPDFCTLSFGAEHANADFLAAAEILDDEKNYAPTMKEFLSKGDSFAVARQKALRGTVAETLLSHPNDVLALEYARAVRDVSAKRNISLLPIERIGDYKSTALSGNFSSATAIRAAYRENAALDALPSLPNFSAEDLQCGFFDQTPLELVEKTAILTSTPQEISRVLDCSEGLENAIYKAAEKNEDVVRALTCKRYTSSRIRRICLHHLLKIEESFIKESLSSPLYIKPLAVKKGREDVLSALAAGKYPCVVRHSDEENLEGIAKACFEKERLAQKIYSAVTKQDGGTKDLFY